MDGAVAPSHAPNTLGSPKDVPEPVRTGIVIKCVNSTDEPQTVARLLPDSGLSLTLVAAASAAVSAVTAADGSAVALQSDILGRQSGRALGADPGLTLQLRDEHLP